MFPENGELKENPPFMKGEIVSRSTANTAPQTQKRCCFIEASQVKSTFPVSMTLFVKCFADSLAPLSLSE